MNLIKIGVAQTHYVKLFGCGTYVALNPTSFNLPLYCTQRECILKVVNENAGRLQSNFIFYIIVFNRY